MQLRSRAAIAIAALTTACAVDAQGIQGCPSGQVSERFEEFGRTGRMPPDLGRWLGDAQAQYIEPYRAFDNVYYVGVCWVSAWVIKTPEGAILLDTLHDPFTGMLIDNLKKVGVEPKDIKYVLMTHGHFDHAGGAYKIKPLTGAQFIMTQAGWNEAVASSSKSQQSPRPWTMIAQDRVVKDGDVIRLGGTEVRALETPGHTFGTASYAFNVTDNGKPYRAITIGGLGLNAIENSKQVEAYIASVDRIAADMADPARAYDVHLTTHGFSTGLPEAAAKLKTRAAGEMHPMVDPGALRKQLAGLRAGAVERLEVEKKSGR